MKKCPNCQKTFDDNMKFCQTDGTPLVSVADNQPEADPYATMVASKSDLDVPPKEEPKEETKEEPKEEVDPYATMVASSQPVNKEESTDLGAVNDNDDDLLDVLGDDNKEEEIDPMKTMVVSGNTADNIKVNIPEEKPKDEQTDKAETPPETAGGIDASEAKTMLSPDLPKFNEPKLDPPNLGSSKQPPKEEPKEQKPAQPAESKPKEEKSAPIPSPFDNSMPPGYAPPSTPPFEPPKEPLKPEPLNEPKKSSTPKSPFADPSKPVVESNTEGFNAQSNTAPAKPAGEQKMQPKNQFESPVVSNDAPGAEGDNKTLAIVSLISGILSFLCCFSIITGPVALITGFMARKNIAENPTEFGGGTLALIGMLTGGVGIIFFIILVILNLMGSLAQFM